MPEKQEIVGLVWTSAVGLDVALMQRVDETLSRITDNPNAFPITYRQLRRAIVKQFPFAVFFEGYGRDRGLRSISFKA